MTRSIYEDQKSQIFIQNVSKTRTNIFQILFYLSDIFLSVHHAHPAPRPHRPHPAPDVAGGPLQVGQRALQTLLAASWAKTTMASDSASTLKAF